jgi:integrase
MAARIMHRLDPDILITAPPGKYNDGGGLYVTITKQSAGIAGSCEFKDRIGLGAFRCVTVPQVRQMLKDARDEAYKLSLQTNPVGARVAAKAAKAQRAAEAAKAMTFRQYAQTYIEAHSAEWTSKVHAGQWTQSLETWVYPIIGDVAIGEIDEPMVLKVFRQSVDGQWFWNAHRVTAERVRQRMDAILDAAKTERYRSAESPNPARWRGHLKNLLPKRQKGEREHHISLPHAELPALMAALQGVESMAARLLEFVILTGVRRDEARLAKWDEFDFTRGKEVWTVPKERMKHRRKHEVPLPPKVAEFLAVKPENRGEYVFIMPSGGPVRSLRCASFL